jgi:enamidase
VLSVKEVAAIVRTAHTNGLLVRAHVNHAALDIALEGGVDIIEHVAMPSFSYQDLEPMFDEAGVFQIPDLLKEQLLQMVEQGIILVPTLDVIITDAYLEGGMAPDQEIVAKAVLAVVRFFHESGGRIALGNDYGNSSVSPGMPLDEMAYLQAAGLTPMEVIVAATKQAALVCGHPDELGTLEIGKLADLIVVDGNPIKDLSVLDSVLYVIKDGEVAVYPQ